MNTARTRVAVIGLGWAGRCIWLPRLLEHGAYEVVAAVDPAPEARALVAQTHSLPLVLADLDELTPAMADLAVVAVPNHMHAPIARRLLARGFGVFVEKPVCLTALEADELGDAEQFGSGALLAGSAARYRADVTALYDLSATLGTLRHIELAWVRASGVPSGAGWFTSSTLSGGGALMDLGWHLLDSALPLLGGAGFDQVLGSVSNDFVNDSSRRAAWRAEDDAELAATDVEDTARGFLVTSGGVAVSLRASWASHEASDSTLIRVEGSRGVATLRCTFGFSPNRELGSTLTISRNGTAELVPLPDDAIGAEYVRQLDAIPGQLADPATKGRAIAEVRPVIDLINRFYHSAAGGSGARQSAAGHVTRVPTAQGI